MLSLELKEGIVDVYFESFFLMFVRFLCIILLFVVLCKSVYGRCFINNLGCLIYNLVIKLVMVDDLMLFFLIILVLYLIFVEI